MSALYSTACATINARILVEKRMLKKYSYRGGFALPTVLIASVVMLTILAVSVSSVTAVRTSLKTQYYEQLAKEAGEAGVAYAKACLAKNGNVPLWTNAKPLLPNTDCSGNAIAGVACPANTRCSVLSTAALRSSFTVPAPAVDGEGKAITIPNSGYVELLRSSNGQAWRTYRQPAVQAAVVPDLCSGAATSSLGWSNVALASGARKATIPGAPAAATITLADADLAAGQMYFRKDFVLTGSETYRVSALTNTANDKVEVYINGGLTATSQGALASGTTFELGPGCYTMTARLTNKTVRPTYSQFTAAMTPVGGTSPTVVTDSSWRVSSGAVVSFSSPDFYEDSDIWKPVVSYSASPHAKTFNAAWTPGGDQYTAVISPPGNGCPGDCPATSTAYLRDSKDIYIPSETSVSASLLCAGTCGLYVDGQLVLDAGTSGDITQQTFTLTQGYHRVGIRLYNNTAASSPAGVMMSLVASGGGATITRTDTSWTAVNSWHSGVGTDITAYEKTFTPSPREIIDPVTADVLVVGGGGGSGRNAAGGGGGGGVRYTEGFVLGTQSYAVSVGGGGAGATSNTVAGASGGASAFGGLSAAGGGGGASRDNGTAGVNGGSGGGGAGGSVASRSVAGNGVAGIGNPGGAGITASPGADSVGGGGGGAGNIGMYGVAGGSAGDGGAGRIFYLNGTRLAVGGGGNGGITVNGSVGSSTDGGGSGTATVGTNGAANTGGGGGAGVSTNVGGAGGTGVVMVRIKTGSATVSTTGAVTTASVNVRGVPYTVYRFTGAGTFTVSALNP